MKLSTKLRHFFAYLFLSLLFIGSLNANEEKIIRVLAELPDWDASNVLIHKIGGGLTNENYKVCLSSRSYFVRCSTCQNALLGVSLDREWRCTSICSKHGLAPKAVLYNSLENILITDFIETHDRKVDLRDPETMQKFCTLVQTLHQLDIEFPTQFCPFDTIQSYLENAESNNAVIPQKFYEEILPFVHRLKNTSSTATRKVPCHLDLHSGNVLDDGRKMWLIDWEYAAMGDPYFDLATSASQENFSDSEMEQLLTVYLNGRTPQPSEINYFYSMRVLVDVRWALWCYLQARISPLNAPFTQFGDMFLYEAAERLHKISVIN